MYVHIYNQYGIYRICCELPILVFVCIYKVFHLSFQCPLFSPNPYVRKYREYIYNCSGMITL